MTEPVPCANEGCPAKFCGNWRGYIRVMIPVLLVVGLLGAPGAQAGDSAALVEDCIAANSGAGSVACLEKVMVTSQKEIARLEADLLGRLLSKVNRDDITHAHYKQAVSSLAHAAKRFEQFRESQCDFVVGASGAVASGSQQVRYSCRIELNDWRIAYLRQTLLANDRPVNDHESVPCADLSREL